MREEAWPAPRDGEETHDALLGLVAVPEAEVPDWPPWVEELIATGRAARATVASDAGPLTLIFAAENLRLIELLYRDAAIEPRLSVPADALVVIEDRDDARRRLLRGWTESSGPVSAGGLSPRLGLGAQDIEYGLRQVESLGFILRGRFTPGATEDEFCDRRLLARIHRYTLDRLRREIDPVSAQDYMRFLLRWQHLTPDTRLAGKTGVRQAVARLQGFEAAAAAWERDLLAARVSDYRSSWLDELCLAGEIVWSRLTPRKAAGTGATPTRSTPLTVALRRDFPMLLTSVRGSDEPAGPKAGAAAEVRALLSTRGALFFDEIVNGTRRLSSDVERGLRELVAWGLVTADGFQGLRQLVGRTSHSGRPRRSNGSSYSAGGFFTGRARATPCPGATSCAPCAVSKRAVSSGAAVSSPASRASSTRCRRPSMRCAGSDARSARASA